MRLNRFIFIFLLFAVPCQAGIIFEQNFEDGREPTSSDGFHTNSANSCCEYNIQNVKDPLDSGNRVILTTTGSGDSSVSGHQYRANMTTVPGGSLNGKPILPYDRDRWFGFSIYISQAAAERTALTNIFNNHLQNYGSTQCVGPSGTTKAPLGMAFLGNNFKWTGPGTSKPAKYYWRFSSHGDPAMNGANENGYFLFLNAEGDIGRWVNFVFHIRHSYSRTGGYMQIWRDGVSIYHNPDWNMADAYIPQSCGNPYPKIGAGAASLDTDGKPWSPIEVYYDNIRWGDENSSYAEVDPSRGSNSTTSNNSGTTTTPPSNNTTVTVLDEITVEAEDGATTGIMTIISESTASGKQYVRTKGSGEGTVSYSVNVASAGIYRMVGRSYVWSSGQNEYLYFKLNSNSEQRWDIDIPYQQWQEVTYPNTFTLNKGSNTITFRGVGDSARLDWFTLEKIDETISAPAGFQLAQ